MDITKTAVAKQAAVADICLYGTGNIGAGWLARTSDGRMYGDGAPVQGRDMTRALWLACDVVRAERYRGVGFGRSGDVVRVFEPSGRLVAFVDIGRALPYFGDLVWSPAPVYTISSEALIAAGTEVR